MRNLKKILALVLALVMSFSLMATANAFKDDQSIDATYAEAVEVLNGLKVFQGYEDGSFQPKGQITRAEVAAIIYRIVTGDVADKQVGIYADYNKFTDVKSGSWYAGYVNFCANAEYIKGYGDGTFGPNDKVTGYQALAMILRAVGYDKNGEFTGANWQVQTAAVGKKLGITDNVSAGTLGTAATREVVAEILFQVIQVPQVEYTVAFGYQSYGKNSISWDTFKLVKGERTNLDKWGRPGYYWFAYSNKAVVATIEEAYLAQYKVATTECQIAADMGLKTTRSVDTYLNTNPAETLVNPLNTLNTVGAQRRLIEVYKDRLVMIDTYLAVVTKVIPTVYDAAGHVKRAGWTEVTVYDKAAGTALVLPEVVDYVAGDYILLNAKTMSAQNLLVDFSVSNISRNSEVTYYEIVGLADSIVGAQTHIWLNAKQHTVEGTVYPDANTYFLDAAGKTAFTNFAWFFDSYGNLIGSAPIATTYGYSILKNMVWNLGNPGYATATLIDAATGEETSVTVSKIDGSKENAADKFAWNVLGATPMVSLKTTDYTFVDNGNGAYAYVAPDSLVNGVYNGYALYRVQTKTDGSVVLAGETVNHIASTTIYNGGTSIQDGSKWVPVNDETIYTVKTGNTYTQYTGKLNVPSLKNAEVFYVMSGAYAKYVYVKSSTPFSAIEGNFIMATQPTTLTMKDSTTTYEVLYKATVNGEPTDFAAKDVLKDSAATIQVLASNWNVPYYVTYEDDGTVKAVNAFTYTDQTVAGTSGVKYRQIALPLKGYTGTTMVDANGSTWDISAAKVIGDYASLAEIPVLTNVNIYVVFTQDAAARHVSQLYIVNADKGGQTDPTDPEEITTGVAHYVVNFYDSNKSEIQSTMSKDQTLDIGTYVAGTDYTATSILEYVGVNPAVWATSYITPTFAITAAGYTTVILNVYPAAAAPVPEL